MSWPSLDSAVVFFGSVFGAVFVTVVFGVVFVRVFAAGDLTSDFLFGAQPITAIIANEIPATKRRLWNPNRNRFKGMFIVLVSPAHGGKAKSGRSPTTTAP